MKFSKAATLKCVITALKSVFSRYRIPEVVMSDNGPPYSLEDLADFAAAYDLTHVSSSPHYPHRMGSEVPYDPSLVVQYFTSITAYGQVDSL